MPGRRADANDVRIGRNIRSERLAKNMSQTALGSEIGVTLQQVQKYEKGINRVGAGRLLRIAAALHVPVTALLAGVPGLERRNKISALAQAYPLRLVKAFKAIDDHEVRRSLMALTEQLARFAQRHVVRQRA